MLFANAFTNFFGKYGTIILMVGAVAVMFIFMFRSQKKQEKEANQMRNNLQIGDEVTTIGGIIGEIVRIKDETVTIETGKDRTKIRILRTAIRSVDVHAADKYGTPAANTAPATEVKVKASKKKKNEQEPVQESVQEVQPEATETENN
jgi:preprotein translocase subunit YajC